MYSDKEFKRTIALIKKSLNRFDIINHDDEIYADPYVDAFTTKQQRARDKKITELLQLYVDAYDYKNKSNRWYKCLLFLMCAGILLAFSITLIVLVMKFIDSTSSKSIDSIIQLITACVTFLTLIVSILKIITKCVFPANDEEYITRIVEIIQNNDLENKKENIRARISKNDNSESTLKSDNDFQPIDKL